MDHALLAYDPYPVSWWWLVVPVTIFVGVGVIQRRAAMFSLTSVIAAGVMIMSTTVHTDKH